MYRIIDNRATGKTSRLMLLAKEQNGIIVCKDPIAMRKKAYDYGIVGIDFIPYHLYLPNERNDERPVFIDELELYLKSWNKNIQGYTISNED